MTLSLAHHENGCVPEKRCRACRAADIIHSVKLGAAQALLFRAPDAAPYDPGSHMPGCTPLAPCDNCRATIILRQRLGNEKFSEFSALLDDRIPLDVFERMEQPGYEYLKEILAKCLDEIEWSVSTANCLKNAGIMLVADLCVLTEGDLCRLPHFGRRNVDEVKDILQSKGLRLGMEIPPDLLPAKK